MEILSDATFKGDVTFNKDVTISGGDFFITRDDNTSLFYVVRDESESDTRSEIVHIDGGAHIDSALMGSATVSGTSYLNGGTNIRNSLDLLGFRTITVFCESITFPSKDGTLALTSDIPSLSGYLTTSTASSTYLSKTDASATYLSKTDALKYKRILIDFDVPDNCTKFTVETGLTGTDLKSMSMFRQVTTSDGGYPSSSDNPLFKQVAVDLYQVGCSHTVLVEKSSSFAIGSSDGYQLRLVY